MKGGSLYTTVYRKPTHTGCYLHFDSNHPFHVKRGVIQSLVNRVNLLCPNEQDHKIEMEISWKDWLSNAYPADLVQSIMYRKPINVNEDKQSNREPLSMVSTPYSRGVSEKFRKIYKRYNTRTIFKTKCTLGSYLGKTIPRLN
ncbi:hypothetical protein Cfor_11325 [Coptotermes formosanus]|uniref:Helix-turn-helix domain-containing protein n=1 Tax=Coptotermes formosanus TaxID=36987 RepID=A0A6L2PAE2_COPFO|nr:hypothetical protein Cfor_11325 [Coptotermes formosanus]